MLFSLRDGAWFACLFLVACGDGRRTVVKDGAGGSAGADQTTGGATAGTRVVGSGGPSNGGDAGAVDAGIPSTDGAAGFACPTAPPFDLNAPGMDRCLETILIGVGDRTRRTVTFDGETWLHDQLDSGNIINGQPLDDSAFTAAFGMGYIVTASDFGIFTSADRGKTWTKAPPPAAQQWNQGIHVSPTVWNGKRFIVFSDSISYTSEDGYVWQRHTYPDLPGGHVAYFGYAVGRNGRVVSSGGQPQVNLSDDGVVWKSVDTGIAGGFTSIAYGNGVFVGVGRQARAYSVDNGDSWTVVNDDCSTNDPALCMGDAPSQLLFREGTFVFTTSKDAVLQGANGKDWTRIGKGFGFDWSHAYFKGTYYTIHGETSYRTAPSAGGPWTDRQFTTRMNIPIGYFYTGLVLKR